MKGEEGLKESLKERINVRTSTGQGAVIKATADLKRKGKRIIGGAGNTGITGFVSIESDKGYRLQICQVKRLTLRHAGKFEGMFFSIDVFVSGVSRL